MRIENNEYFKALLHIYLIGQFILHASSVNCGYLARFTDPKTKVTALLIIGLIGVCGVYYRVKTYIHLLVPVNTSL